MQEVYGNVQPKHLLSGPTSYLKRSSCFAPEASRVRCLLHVLAHSRCLINGRWKISWVHGPTVWQSGTDPELGSWLPSPLSRMCKRGSRMHHCGMRLLLIQMSFLTSQGIYYVDSWMTRHGTGRALKGHFIATVMFQISLQRRAFSHEWLLIRKTTIANTFQVPDTAQRN